MYNHWAITIKTHVPMPLIAVCCRASRCQPARGLGHGYGPQRQAVLLAQGDAEDAVGEANGLKLHLAQQTGLQHSQPDTAVHQQLQLQQAGS